MRYEMLPILLTILIVLPSTDSFVDCRIACRTCRANREAPSVLEVYCAMCDECKQRRREKMQNGYKDRVRDDYAPTPYLNQPRDEFHQEVYRQRPQAFRQQLRQLREDELQTTVQGYPEGCPTAPYCTDSSAEEKPATHAVITTTCPPTSKCVKKLKKTHTSTSPNIQYITVPVQQPSCCCTPMQFCGPNQCQCSNVVTVATVAPTTAAQPQVAAATKDFVHVYVGLPKEVLRIG